MSIILRTISGAVGLAILVSTVVLALDLVSMEHDARVYLAGYMAIGGILVGAYLLYYAVRGTWRPGRTGRKKGRQGLT